MVIVIGIMVLVLIIFICIWVTAIDKVDINDPVTRDCMSCSVVWCMKDPYECYKERHKDDEEIIEDTD